MSQNHKRSNLEAQKMGPGKCSPIKSKAKSGEKVVAKVKKKARITNVHSGRGQMGKIRILSAKNQLWRERAEMVSMWVNDAIVPFFRQIVLPLIVIVIVLGTLFYYPDIDRKVFSIVMSGSTIWYSMKKIFGKV